MLHVTRKISFAMLFLLPLLLPTFGQTQGQGGGEEIPITSEIKWDDSYPKTGTSSGTIDVAGKITLLPDHEIVGNSVTVRVWQDSGQLVTKTLTATVDPMDSAVYTWGASSVSGLTSSQPYNLTADAAIDDGFNVRTIATEPRTAAAK